MRQRFVLASAFAFAVSAALVLPGCGKFKKTKECNAFIDKVNTAIKEIEQHSGSKGSDDAQVIASMKKLGDLYDQLAKDVTALEVTTPELKSHAANYKEMCTKAASTARQVATAIETKNPEQAETAQKEFDKIVKQEDDLVNQINTFCQAP
ncbi:MAG: hypothetical protein IT375_34275 [Polyangiaceae bacterium]|nr:hypothetical protein [Polyangiaceae bacterium]MCK6535009.1 hypothetical protein [Polyangiaceae bacterium]